MGCIRKTIIGFLYIPICLTGLSGIAQELNCNVTVNATQIQSDKTVFEGMERAIFEFMNNTKWTGDQFSPEERIECSILINVTERIGTNEFKGTMQIQARRPVYNSSYSTTIFNHSDPDVQFLYSQFDQMQFSESTYLSELTSLLAFYAYIVIGLDYDSFSNNGGTAQFQKALAVLNAAQTSAYSGWKAFEGTMNRYWMVNNMLDQFFKPLRDCQYHYHRSGFDQFTTKKEEGRKQILTAIQGLQKIHQNRPNSFNMYLFFNAKSDEIVKVFSEASQPEKAKIVDVLNRINPSNMQKYNRILTARK